MTTAHVQEIERLNRLYSALSQINQAIVRTEGRDQLLHRVCAALVEHGGFRMAWIGWHDPATHRLLPVAHVGDDNGHLQRVPIYADERPEGRGPSSIAFRTNQPYICHDLFADPATLPWRAEAKRSGFTASAALPIRTNGAVVGTLSVYAARHGNFQGDEISLLVESTDDAIFSQTLDGQITSWNPAAESVFGYSPEEVIGRSVQLLIPTEGLEDEPAIQESIRRGEHVKQRETMRRRKDGALVPVSITVSPIWAVDEGQSGTSGRVGASWIVRDITEHRKAEELVQREQRLVSGLIEAMPGIFYLYDEQGRFLRWNRNFERVSGYGADEIATMHPLDLFGEDEKPLLAQRIAEVFEKGEATVEASFLAKDGSQAPFFFTGKRIELEGAPSLVGVGVDISERRRAEETVRKSEERYRTTLDTMLEGCQLIGFDWRYLYLNPAAALHNRRSNSELLGQRMTDAWPGIEQSDVFALLRRCMNQRVPVHSETEFAFADGSTAWFDVRAQPVPEGIFVLSLAISERKQAERALRELNESLERKVAERTLALEAARERAEAADRLKSAFLATMSHELRTPLNSILGFTGIVLKGMAGPLSAEQHKQLGMVQGSARHLLDLINDVLDISKIEAGQLQVRRAPFDLRASIARVSASVLPLAQKKGLTLQVTVPELLDEMASDQRRVEQILLNLLNNAIKFTDRGAVTLGLELVDAGEPLVMGEQPPFARIRVTDTGIGIKPDDLSKLFQPFLQLDSGLQRQHEGTGLGLAICRRLTGLLGGSIFAESLPERGSAFTVLLPMNRSVRS
jgi:PAS domain S-box-containing protein